MSEKDAQTPTDRLSSGRARLNRWRRVFLAASVVAAGTMSWSEPAHAVFSPCLAVGSPLPPPCLVIDASKIAEQVTTLKNITEQLQNLAKVGENLADLKKIISAEADAKDSNALKGTLKGWVPVAPGVEVSFAKAANELAALMPEKQDMDQIETDAQRAAMIIGQRSASGDGWSIAQSIKGRLDDMRADGDLLAKAVGQCSTSLRNDMQINTHARLLYLRSLTALREARQNRAVYKAVVTVAQSPTDVVPTYDREDAPDYTPPARPDYAGVLTQIALKTAEMLALKNGSEAGALFAAAIGGLLATKEEYNSLVQVTQIMENNVVTLAQSEARSRGLDPNALLRVVNTAMANADQTTWDNENKMAAATSAAQQAKAALERAVGGKVSDAWIDALVGRAEAYKQAAFFETYVNDSNDYIDATRRAQAAYSEGLNQDISKPQEINAQIAALQGQIDQLKATLSNAPEEIQTKADEISKQINVATGAVPPDVNAGAIEPDPEPDPAERMDPNL